MSTAIPKSQLIFYGVQDVCSDTDIDLTLLRERLKLTVIER